MAQTIDGADQFAVLTDKPAELSLSGLSLAWRRLVPKMGAKRCQPFRN